MLRAVLVVVLAFAVVRRSSLRLVGDRCRAGRGDHRRRPRRLGGRLARPGRRLPGPLHRHPLARGLDPPAGGRREGARRGVRRRAQRLSVARARAGRAHHVDRRARDDAHPHRRRGRDAGRPRHRHLAPCGRARAGPCGVGVGRRPGGRRRRDRMGPGRRARCGHHRLARRPGRDPGRPPAVPARARPLRRRPPALARTDPGARQCAARHAARAGDCVAGARRLGRRPCGAALVAALVGGGRWCRGAGVPRVAGRGDRRGDRGDRRGRGPPVARSWSSRSRSWSS